MTEEEEIKTVAPEIPVEPEVSSFKLIISLGLAGLFSGLVIVGSYIYTLPIIEQNKADAQRRAIFKVLEGCSSFSTYYLVDGGMIAEADFTADADETPKAFAGFDDSGQLIGFAIPGAEPGFQDIIGAIFGYDLVNETIIGFEVLESKETPGLGDKIFKDEDFALNFKALAVMPEIIPAKPGAKTQDNEVETISGATISSKAVVRLLNNAVADWYEPMKNMDTSTLQPPAESPDQTANDE